MAVQYLKKATKTPTTGEDDTRAAVDETLRDIESGGEARALHYAEKLDGWKGEVVVSRADIESAASARSSRAEGMVGHTLTGDDRLHKYFRDEVFHLEA